MPLALILGTGCYRGSDHHGQADSADGSGTEHGNDDEEEGSCEGMQVVPVPMRRMTDEQYRNTIRDLFDGVVVPGAEFPSTAASDGYSGDADNTLVSQLDAEQMLAAAETVAARVVDAIEQVVPCEIELAGKRNACAEAWIADFVRRAYRRPPQSEELAMVTEIYWQAAAEAGFADGIGAVVTVVLQSPQFLYFVERGDGTDPTDVLRLTSHEIATRLSYLLWDTMPDPELAAAANADLLRDRDVLEAQARRMLADSRSVSAMVRFHREWVLADALDPTGKDKGAFPAYASLAAALERELAYFVESTLFGDGTLRTLLTSNATWVDPALADYFGIEAPNPGGWAETELPAGRWPGLLGRPAVLASHASSTSSSVVARGKMMRNRILCVDIPPPPPGAQCKAPEFPADATQRERSEALLAIVECRGCHMLMNPLGYGFENYDAIGKWRDIDVDGSPIDASGEVFGADEPLTGSFAGAAELVERMADSRQVKECVVVNWLHYALGKPAASENGCVVEEVTRSFEASNEDIVELVVALIGSDAFSHRKTEDGQ